MPEGTLTEQPVITVSLLYLVQKRVPIGQHEKRRQNAKMTVSITHIGGSTNP